MGKTVSKTIRVPRTTAMFITGLAHVLRTHFGMDVTEHEHWTFEQVGQWVECFYPGECGDHGVSKKARAKRLKEEGPGPWPDYDRSYFGPCLSPYVMSSYTGIGQVKIGYRNIVELRTVIEKTEQSHFGDNYIAQVWARYPDGTIKRGTFMLLDNGQSATFDVEGKTRENPPNRLAFWRSPEVPASRPIKKSTRRSTHTSASRPIETLPPLA